jgi:predicted nucleotide-binding protein (sugar kinase/HSP70/actin superfamily)
MIHAGDQVSPASTCLPLKIAYGHCHQLVERGAGRLLVPSVASLSRQCGHGRLNHLCPGAQAWPFTVAPELSAEVELLAPTARLALPHQARRDLIAFGSRLGYSSSQAASAFERAQAVQKRFHDSLTDCGDELLANLDSEYVTAVILSRPYVLAEHTIVGKLRPIFRALKIRAIPFDMIRAEPLSVQDLGGMYWYYGKRFLQVIRALESNSSITFIFLSTFACGADSFIIHLLRDALKGRPFLELEIDQHGDFTGVHTRLEAFVNSLKRRGTSRRPRKEAVTSQISRLADRRILVPQMSDHAFSCAAALRAVGQPSEVLPLPTDRSVALGKKVVTGGECLPCAVLAGDMLSSLDGNGHKADHAAFLMISGDGPCRLGQYPYLHRQILDRCGFTDVPIVDMSQDTSFYDRCDIFSTDFKKMFWRGSVAIDLLHSMYHEIRPTVEDRPSLDAAYRDEVSRLCEAQATSRGLTVQLERSFDRLACFRAAAPGPVVTIGLVGENYIRCNRSINHRLTGSTTLTGQHVYTANTKDLP